MLYFKAKVCKPMKPVILKAPLFPFGPMDQHKNFDLYM